MQNTWHFYSSVSFAGYTSCLRCWTLETWGLLRLLCTRCPLKGTNWHKHRDKHGLTSRVGPSSLVWNRLPMNQCISHNFWTLDLENRGIVSLVWGASVVIVWRITSLHAVYNMCYICIMYYTVWYTYIILYMFIIVITMITIIYNEIIWNKTIYTVLLLN